MNANERAIEKEKYIFEQLPIPKALAAMILPTILSQIIHVVYNLADTWFVGLTNDPNAVAAVSLCLPVYNLLTGFSNMFGIGGASVVSRALGLNHPTRARRAFSCAFWCAALAAVGYSLLLLTCMRPLLLLIGGNEGSIDYAVSYTVITILIGGLPTILAATVSHLFRAAGESGIASRGMIVGAVLNIALDPLFMFVLLPRGNEVAGAAIATALSNLASLVYFGVNIHRRKGLYCVDPRLLRQAKPVAAEIVRCGAPGFLMVALAMFANCFLNAAIAMLAGSAGVAGIGIVRKVDSLAYAVNQGITQGMLPIVAYCYATGKRRRMWTAFRYSMGLTVGFSLICTLVSLLLAPELIRLFIRDAETIRYGAWFLRVITLTIPIYSGTFIIIAAFQAIGRSTEPFLLSILHTGTLDVVLMLLIIQLLPLQLVLWASPITELLALVVGLVMIRTKFLPLTMIEKENLK